MSVSVWYRIVTIFVFYSLSSRAIQAQSTDIQFSDITQKTGIDFLHCDGGTGKHYIVETVSSGLAVFDFDNDGYLDIYFLNGAYPKPMNESKPLANRLYRNLGNWKFVDVTEKAGIGDLGHGLGVTVGDYDNDGDADVYVNNFGPNVLYCNNGDGTFSRVATAPGANESRVGAGASFIDIEGDGDLDLFVGNYIKFSYEKDVNRMILGVPAAPGPKDYDPDSDQLFRNDGSGSFTDISVESGIAAHAGPSMGMIGFDYDKDGDIDIFVCNDSAANFLWNNDGLGHFSEVGQLSGVAYNYAGLRQANMGTDCADYDLDGWMDFVVSNFQDEIPQMFRSSKGIFFDELGAPLGLGTATRNVKWGVVFSDFDHDRYPDLYFASGHLIDGVEKLDSSIRFATKNHLFRNIQGKRFADVSSAAGGGLEVEKVSRGVASDDLDGDGDLDLVVLNLNSSPTVLCNESNLEGKHWIKLHLIGTKDARDAVGARVVLKTRHGEQMQEVLRGRGYQSHYGNSLHFGLGDATAIEQLEITWLNKEKQVFKDLAPDQEYWLIQGREASEPIPKRD